MPTMPLHADRTYLQVIFMIDQFDWWAIVSENGHVFLDTPPSKRREPFLLP